MTLRIVQGLVKTEALQGKSSSGQQQAAAKNAAFSSAATTASGDAAFTAIRYSKADSLGERLRNSNEAKDVAKGVAEKVRGDKGEALAAHDLDTDAGRDILSS